MEVQKTIENEISYSGKSLHTGTDVKITLKPAPENTGIIFKRVDLKDAPDIPAKIDFVNVKASLRRTILEKDTVRVHTIEHLLSCCNAYSIDNLIIEIDGEEPPAADGAAEVFLRLIEHAGIVQQSAPRKIFTLTSEVIMRQDGIEIIAIPSNRLEVTFFVVYEDNFIGRQGESFIINPEIYSREIAPARTYCFEEEIENLQKAGLGMGGTLENVVVVGKDKYLNDHLRFNTEIVRHKILDLVGDLYLLGGSLKAHILSLRSGHLNNVRFVNKLLESCKIVTE